MDEKINYGVVERGDDGNPAYRDTQQFERRAGQGSKQDLILSFIRGALTSISADTEISFQVRYRSSGV